MQKKVTIAFNKISFLQPISLEDILNIFSNNPYSEKDGIGFTNANILDNYIESTLIKRIPTSLQEFDILSNSFVQRNIFVFDEITFYLDLEHELLYSFSSVAKLNKVKTVLKKYIQGRILYQNIDLKPMQIINNLIEDFEWKIHEIAIKKFIYNQGAIGKYIAQILDDKIGQKLMTEYADEIQKITFELSSNLFENFILTVSTNNTLSIKCEEEELFCIIENIKNQLK
jgi:hypothetical protein